MVGSIVGLLISIIVIVGKLEGYWADQIVGNMKIATDGGSHPFGDIVGGPVVGIAEGLLVGEIIGKTISTTVGELVGIVVGAVDNSVGAFVQHSVILCEVIVLVFLIFVRDHSGTVVGVLE